MWIYIVILQKNRITAYGVLDIPTWCSISTTIVPCPALRSLPTPFSPLDRFFRRNPLVILKSLQHLYCTAQNFCDPHLAAHGSKAQDLDTISPLISACLQLCFTILLEHYFLQGFTPSNHANAMEDYHGTLSYLLSTARAICKISHPVLHPYRVPDPGH
jgi:hypothetical protein